MFIHRRNRSNVPLCATALRKIPALEVQIVSERSNYHATVFLRPCPDSHKEMSLWEKLRHVPLFSVESFALGTVVRGFLQLCSAKTYRNPRGLCGRPHARTYPSRKCHARMIPCSGDFLVLPETCNEEAWWSSRLYRVLEYQLPQRSIADSGRLIPSEGQHAGILSN